ncbi:MAG: 5-methyltetrahydropteroyltriglutamate--homocysteine S-methyltransferase [Corynebacterium sp.]|nr:5-methyltetrahydropteroyltriglutamate--homocysteine S-methyltransferase [Corynebacterium sp.]
MTNLFAATIAAPPRIGAKRELKFALENFWAGRIDEEELLNTARTINTSYALGLEAAGFDSIPTIGTSLYDSVLDLSAALGVLPARFAGLEPLEAYFATARGRDNHPAAAMKKWFNTNYHYIVPELQEAVDEKSLNLAPKADIFLDGVETLIAAGIPAHKIRPVLVGPATYLYLSDLHKPYDKQLLIQFFEAFRVILRALAKTGVGFIQIDEPVFALDFLAENPVIRASLVAEYRQLAREFNNLIVASYFGEPDLLIDSLDGVGLAGLAIDVTTRSASSEPISTRTPLILGVVDGRNIWALTAEQNAARSANISAPAIARSSSCSLLHVPYDSSVESFPDALASRVSFGYDKWKEILHPENLPRHSSKVQVDTSVAQIYRDDFEVRVASQPSLGPLPTTTIGSFPQTAELRALRADYRAGRISSDAYDAGIKAYIAECIKLQEELGLDVLVHGEPERNDMVQYFAELLPGCATTSFGWVQSYGSRCVRPPIIYSDVTPAPEGLGTSWFKYAQSLTAKPVKGMLTGPVTIIAWSFVREDQPLAVTAGQIAAALRTEIAALEEAGAQHIQVDEPAIRELLPLKKAEQAEYFEWATRAFRQATGGAKNSTVIHTHMCYSAFEEIIDIIAGLDADVISIEAARDSGAVATGLAESPLVASRGIGLGVWDIHSPRVPSVEEISAHIRRNRAVLPHIWVNPDCGLKTRGWEECIASLRNMVEAVQNTLAPVAK